MKVFRQLGTWGSVLVFGPILWLGACWTSRSLAQHAYDEQITPITRVHRIPAGDIPSGGVVVTDRLALAELRKYLRVWGLETGACADFPDAARFPFSLNPFKASATFMRLRQKQAFLLSQRHGVRRHGNEWAIAPDPRAALGGRRFRVETENLNLIRAWELAKP